MPDINNVNGMASDDPSGPDDLLLDWLNGIDHRERMIQHDNREQMAIDEDFEDGIQWMQEYKDELDERGQPALAYNEIKPMIQWLLGTERRSRADYSIEPRNEQDVEPAIRKTKLFKYISDINNAEYQRSLAFQDSVRVGIGWLKTSVEYDAEGKPKYIYKHIPWREMWYDSRSRALDYTDGRYVIRQRYIDVEDARAYFPDCIEAIDGEAQSDRAMTTADVLPDPLEDEFRDARFYHGSVRQLILIKECWYKRSERVQMIRTPGHALDGQPYDKKNPDHVQARRDKQVNLMWCIRKKTYVVIYLRNKILHKQESPFKHDRFIYTPIWGYRYGRNGHPYGAIRNARDPQESLNKRRSKALFLMSTRRVVMDEDAADTDMLQDEMSRPDSIIKKKKGSSLEITENTELAPAHTTMAEQDSAYIRLISGVTGENLGLNTNATSGIAIQARQEQGTVTTTTLFDNLALGMKLAGQILLSNLEQFCTEQMEFRITGTQNKPEFVRINDGDPENDISNSEADFVVSEQDFKATIRAAMSQQLMQSAQGLPPAMAMQIIISAIELSNLPNKDDLLPGLRQAAGIPNPESPEEQQAEQQAKAAQQQQQMQEQQAALAKVIAQTKLMLSQADNQNALAMNAKLDALVGGISAAGLIRADGTLAPTADSIMQNLDDLTGEPKAAGLPNGGVGLPAPGMPPVSDQPPIGNSPQPMPLGLTQPGAPIHPQTP